MKKITCSKSPETDILTAPAYPEPGYRLVDELRRRLNLAEGYEASIESTGAMLGLSKSTFSNWCNHTENPPVQVLFGLLERLPEAECIEFVRRHRRVFPTLNHQALAHEPAVVEHLRSLLNLTSGLTVIESESDYARHFILGTFGHTFPRHDAVHRPVAGMVCQPPGKLVPLQGVYYLKTGVNRKMVIEIVNRLWPQISNGDTPLVLLEGVWSQVPGKRENILKLSRSRHVVLADEFRRDERFGAAKGQIRRLLVSGSPLTALKIKLRLP